MTNVVEDAERPSHENQRLDNQGLKKMSHEKDERPDPSIDPENEITGLRLLVLHAALCLCTFLVGLDFNLIATAVPQITSHFHYIGDVGWYGAAFYIAMCASQPLAGKTFILFPKKAVYLCYLGIFELGSLVCALAPSSKSLVVGRAIIGLGASGIFAGGLIIVTTVIPLHKRAIWQSTINSTFAIASIVGPVIGGALTQHVTWRWLFYLNLPIGGFSAAVVLLFLRLKSAPTESAPLTKKLKGLDLFGFVLFAGSVIMLLLALQWGGSTYSWKSSVVIGLFVGSGVIIPIFIAWQAYFGEHALIPYQIFTNRNTVLIFLGATFSNGPFQTVVYWLPIWFQSVLGASPTSSGVRYLPTVISDVLTSFIGSGIVMKLGPWNPFLLAGYSLMSIGSGLLTTLYPDISMGKWIGYQILCGVGYSLVINMAHLGVQASLPPETVPIGATTLLFGMSTSCAVFLAIGQAVFENRLRRELFGVVSQETADAVLSTGATQIRHVVSPMEIMTVVRAYSKAVVQVFFIPAAAPVLAFLVVCGTTWISLKKPDTKKEVVEKEIDP